MGVYRDRGVWWLSFTPYKGAKRVRESTGLSVDQPGSEAEAEAILAKVKSQIREGKWFPEAADSAATIADVGRLWFDRDRTKAKLSLGSDQQRWKTIERQLGPSTLLTSLTTAMVKALWAHLASLESRRGVSETNPTGKLSPATVNRHKALLRSVLRYARKEGKQVRDPILASIEITKEDNQRERLCTDEEYQQLCSITSLGGTQGAARTSVQRLRQELVLAVKIGHGSPLRLGATVSLQWSQIQDGGVTLTIVRKGKPRPRFVPLSADAVEALRTHPRRLDGFVFAPPAKQLAKVRQLSSAFGYYCEKLGIVGLTFHDLKHTSLTAWHEEGLDQLDLQALSGHKTLSMLARYVHPKEDRFREIRKRMDEKSGSRALPKGQQA